MTVLHPNKESYLKNPNQKNLGISTLSKTRNHQALLPLERVKKVRKVVKDKIQQDKSVKIKHFSSSNFKGSLLLETLLMMALHLEGKLVWIKLTFQNFT